MRGAHARHSFCSCSQPGLGNASSGPLASQTKPAVKGAGSPLPSRVGDGLICPTRSRVVVGDEACGCAGTLLHADTSRAVKPQGADLHQRSRAFSGSALCYGSTRATGDSAGEQTLVASLTSHPPCSTRRQGRSQQGRWTAGKEPKTLDCPPRQLQGSTAPGSQAAIA